MNKAVVLLSGGLDSATILYDARARGYSPQALIFSYGQRHRKEIRQAQAIARGLKCPFHLVDIGLPWKGSSLLDTTKRLPRHESVDPQKIPSTYVPARNLIFLSFAASFAEVIGAQAIFIGANAIDYSGYPDCRPDFFKAFEKVLKTGMKSGVQGHELKIEAPLLRKTKAQIIRYGTSLGVPYGLTWSCYQGQGCPCGVCDSCRLRAKGFADAGLEDPLLSDRKSGIATKTVRASQVARKKTV